MNLHGRFDIWSMNFFDRFSSKFHSNSSFLSISPLAYVMLTHLTKRSLYY